MANFLNNARRQVIGPTDEEKRQEEQRRQQQQQQQQQQQRQQQQQHHGAPAPFGGVMMGAQTNTYKPSWETRLGQCNEPATCEHWMLSCFCFQCAAAKAKTQTDGTNCCYNVLCWHFGGAASFIRREYEIDGSCGDDLMLGLFCTPCVVRRSLTESELRGKVPGPMGQQGQNQNQWSTTLFNCGCCEFFEALLCPFCVAHYTRNMIQPRERGDCCFDMLCLIPTAMYGQVRHRYNIIAEFDCCEDVMLPLVCFPCALAQARREATVQQQRLAQPQRPMQGGRNGRGGCCCC